MIPTISIDNIISSISLILVTISTLRAASRLEYRINNHGSIGLMDGPPILGPSIVQHTPQSEVVKKKQQREDGTNNDLDDDDIIKDTSNIEGDQDTTTIEASPLWEHTEAFRRAVILGLIFDNDDISNSEDSNSDNIFSNIIRNEEEKTINNVRGGSNDNGVDDLAAAGLLIPSTTSDIERRRRRSFAPRRLVRGGFQKKSSKATPSKDNKSSNSNNPISKMTTWFIRELSAPIDAIPTWHKLFSSYLNEQKKRGHLQNKSGRSSGKAYDSSILDCNSYISGVAHIPSCDILSDSSTSTKSIRVKAFAPQTFRDLRNKCFRVKEKEYAKSILNAMNGAVSIDNRVDRPILENDDSMSNILRAILKGRPQRNNKRIRRGTIQTLPYISFQSNSKGAARVGTFFFFTADGAFMVKTIKKEEANAFLGMLPEYHKFMSDNVNGRNSLLTRIFGMYSVKFLSDEETESTADDDRWDGGLYSPSSQHKQATSIDLADDERVYLVMHSVFPPDASAFITERFDLKGSTVGRKCSLEERQSKGANAVLKDLDLMKEVEEELDEAKSCRDTSQKKRRSHKSSHHGICIGRRRKNALMAQLERDIDLLHRCNVLDYSLLVGVADMELSQDKRRANLFSWMNFPMPYFGAGMTTVDGGALSALPGTRRGKHVMYFLGVIDFLQPWTVKKRLERDLKGLAGYDKTAISCVAPADYATRFLNFCNTHVT